jgi:hypothetical protein
VQEKQEKLIEMMKMVIAILLDVSLTAYKDGFKDGNVLAHQLYLQLRFIHNLNGTGNPNWSSISDSLLYTHRVALICFLKS